MVQSDYGDICDHGDMDTLPSKDIATAFYQKYEPREILGKGVSSTVRRAIYKETGESFAVKIIIFIRHRPHFVEIQVIHCIFRLNLLALRPLEVHQNKSLKQAYES